MRKPLQKWLSSIKDRSHDIDLIDTSIRKFFQRSSVVLSVFTVFTTLYVFGTPSKYIVSPVLVYFQSTALFLYLVILTYNQLYCYRHKIKVRRKVNSLFITLMLFVLFIFNHNDAAHAYCASFIPIRLLDIGSYLFLNFIAIGIISEQISVWLKSTFNPSHLFAGSFAIIILAGTLLLMLPVSTTQPISFTDALFTATSAVCVTGLSTVDPSIVFTEKGFLIIILLIQIGGLGVLTISSFFTYLFVGKSTLGQDMMVKDIFNEENFSGIIGLLKNIVITTFVIEAIGALIIFQAIDGKGLEDAKFAIFHSVSAFCNAGFSTTSNGLYNEILRYNYPLHLMIATLIIMGGIGFPFLKDVEHYAKSMFKRLYEWLVYRKEYRSPVHHVSVNTKLALRTTFWLLAIGTVCLFISEYHNLIEGRSLFGKITTSFFMAVTPRTAGFNTVALSEMSTLGVAFTIILMWIGASPVSTGGGVKTTTIALLFFSTVNIIKGNNRIEIYNREINQATIFKAIALITLSLSSIAVGAILLIVFNPELTHTQAIFECVSAISTVGLTLDVTPTLNMESKYVIIALMFIGRVGLLVLLSIMAKPNLDTAYRYPQQSLIIG